MRKRIMEIDKEKDRNILAVEKKWFPFYKALATLELDNPEIRKDKKTIAYLNQLGYEGTSTSLERYWERVKFTANNSHGNVLEIGCSTGNITKHISRNENVDSVLAVDISPNYIDFQKQLHLNKVNARVLNLTTETLIIDYKIDCVVMAEIIEHITTIDEISILEHIQNNLSNKAKFIISTPIGFMPSPTHIRGFSPIACVIHILLFYGNILKKSDNGTQQFYVVQYRNRNFIWKLYKYLNGVKEYIKKLFSR